MKLKFCFFLIIISLATINHLNAQGSNGTVISDDYEGPKPSLLFLGITPDARAASMGEVGAATDPDVNSIYWNPGKLTQATEDMGLGISYTPWLRNLGVPDMSISNLSGYKKLGNNQAFGLSILYFDLGSFEARDNTGLPNGTFLSSEYSLTGTYSRKLSDILSLGVNIKYINSNISGNSGANGSKPARTVASDVGLYGKVNNNQDWNISYGIMISNISGKVSYGNDYSNFIPTNLKLGTALSKELSNGNKFSFGFDINKLMVPSGERTALEKVTALAGMFKSLGQSPESINLSLGTEYTVGNLLSIRGGYFNETKKSGNRKYFTTGLSKNRQQILH